VVCGCVLYSVVRSSARAWFIYRIGQGDLGQGWREALWGKPALRGSKRATRGSPSRERVSRRMQAHLRLACREFTGARKRGSIDGTACGATICDVANQGCTRAAWRDSPFTERVSRRKHGLQGGTSGQTQSNGRHSVARTLYNTSATYRDVAANAQFRDARRTGLCRGGVSRVRRFRVRINPKAESRRESQ
jgi:hypothetical protein